MLLEQIIDTAAGKGNDGIMNGDGTDQQDVISAETTQAGFAALIGGPNAGKSTLMNVMVGQKVSTTPKVQTTRSRIWVSPCMRQPRSFLSTPRVFLHPNGGWTGRWSMPPGKAEERRRLLLRMIARGEPDEDTLKIIEKLAEVIACVAGAEQDRSRTARTTAVTRRRDGSTV